MIDDLQLFLYYILYYVIVESKYTMKRAPGKLKNLETDLFNVTRAMYEPLMIKRC